ncbi:MAG: 30S ribosome-binding factor RbfA [Candidatus Omnitrophota bacterium]
MGRMERLNETFKREISLIIQKELKDPRLGFITINRVEITKDLSYAKIFFTVLGSEKDANLALHGLQSAAGYIRRLLSDRIEIRHSPELVFTLDKSIEYSMHIYEEIERLKNESKKSSKRNKKT